MLVSRTRQASDPPKRPPSFVCEVPLRVTHAQERTLLARLEAARQVYNACLAQARARARLVRASKAFQHARTLAHDDPGRKRFFAQARQQHAFSDDALQTFAKPFGHSWLGEHLDSHVLQTLASRAYGAANRLRLRQAKRVRCKGRHHLDSVEGKTTESGIRWSRDHVEWLGLVLPALIDKRDRVVAHGLSCPVTYVRLVRRKLGERTRFYAQVVGEGRPYRKPQHALGQGMVGLDLGPSTSAVVAEEHALLHLFCPEVIPDIDILPTPKGGGFFPVHHGASVEPLPGGPARPVGYARRRCGRGAGTRRSPGMPANGQTRPSGRALHRLNRPGMERQAARLRRVFQRFQR